MLHNCFWQSLDFAHVSGKISARLTEFLCTQNHSWLASPLSQAPRSTGRVRESAQVAATPPAAAAPTAGPWLLAAGTAATPPRALPPSSWDGVGCDRAAIAPPCTQLRRHHCAVAIFGNAAAPASDRKRRGGAGRRSHRALPTRAAARRGKSAIVHDSAERDGAPAERARKSAVRPAGASAQRPGAPDTRSPQSESASESTT